MAVRHFDDGWNAGLAGLWSPPLLEGQKAKLDYQEGWRQARAEVLLLATASKNEGKRR